LRSRVAEARQKAIRSQALTVAARANRQAQPYGHFDFGGQPAWTQARVSSDRNGEMLPTSTGVGTSPVLLFVTV
jgi:hypothetical protein